MRINTAVTQCDLGWVLVAATEKGICAIELGDDPDEMEKRVRAERLLIAAYIRKPHNHLFF